MSQIKERLTELCAELGISVAKFSQSIGKNREYIHKITGEIGTDVLRQIYLTFPNVNIVWIVTGEGEILLTDDGKGVNYLKNTDLLDRLIKKSEDVGRLEEEVKQLKALLSIKKDK